jgi:hypothetical protein
MRPIFPDAPDMTFRFHASLLLGYISAVSVRWPIMIHSCK